MPELPEVETVRAGVARHVLGRTVVGAQVHHPRAVRRQSGGVPAFASRLVGTRAVAAGRRGKYLWLELDGAPGGDGSGRDDSRGAVCGDQALLVHLGMSGQLLVRAGSHAVGGSDPVPPTNAPRDAARSDAARPDAAYPDVARHLRVALELDDGTQLWFVDQRTFGHLLVTDLVPTPDALPGGALDAAASAVQEGHQGPVPAMGERALVPAEVAHIARDLLDPYLDLDALVRATRRRRTEVKRALLDQSLVSGIGNIYADEALWRARLHGRRRTETLTGPKLRELYAAAADVERAALAQGGTSFDELYVDVNGRSGYFARHLDAYGREGRPCARCGAPIVRERFMNRASHFCPVCQRKR